MLGLRNKRILLPFILATIFASNIYAQSTPSLEYQVKASFIFNFLKFIEWPPDKFHVAGRELQICALGEERFGKALSVLVNEEINNAKIRIARFETADNMTFENCTVVFINRSLEGSIPIILNRIGNKSILTIGESDNFLEHGGIINFIIEDKKIRFEINNEAATRAGLVISSKLLRLASNVK